MPAADTKPDAPAAAPDPAKAVRDAEAIAEKAMLDLERSEQQIAALRAELAAAKAGAEEHAKARAAAEKLAAEKAGAAAQAAHERDAATKQLAAMAEELRIRPLAPGAKVGKPVFLAKCRISLGGGAAIEPGEPLPFDPTAPPPGFEGFLPGVHYETR